MPLMYLVSSLSCILLMSECSSFGSSVQSDVLCEIGACCKLDSFDDLRLEVSKFHDARLGVRCYATACEKSLTLRLGHDSQIELPYDRQRDLFIAFNCDREISHRSFLYPKIVDKIFQVD